MYTLFWEKGAGSIVVQAMLEEFGVNYETRYIDMALDEHKGSEYLRQNPAGLVPALRLPDQETMGESAAIVLYLCEQHAEGRLAPRAGDKERPEFLYWLIYMATSGYTTFGRACHPERYTKDENATEAVRLAAEEDVSRFFEVLENAIKGAPFFLLSGFSALDIYLSMMVEFHDDKLALFGHYPKIALLCEAIELRPAYNKAITFHA
jgi:glutathione S-transferase